MYRKIMLVVCMLVAQYSFAQKKATTEKIVFATQSWADVLAMAAKTHKYIFVDAYTSWCGPCKMLKTTTFTDAKAAAYFNENFINFSADMEKGEGVMLAEKWSINAYPTLLFFNPEGKMVLMQTGYVNAVQLTALGKEALAKK